MFERNTIIVAVLAVSACLCTGAQAVMYGFTNITHVSAIDEAIGEAQMFVDVTDAGSGNVTFAFTNTGPDASSITRVYFDDSENDSNPLAAFDSLVNGVGVDFVEGTDPSNLPGSTLITPVFSANFDFGSVDPRRPNGVNPGEYLSLTFNLAGGASFGDVIDDLENSTLRIGIKVQGFDDGGNEAMINNTKPVPAPGAVVLAGIGLAVTALNRRRNRGQEKA
ncbi:MAG: hypothetical protein AABZ47_16835 [Planctomycetota bacterium]|mgnify:CR=1 FL=1